MHDMYFFNLICGCNAIIPSVVYYYLAIIATLIILKILVPKASYSYNVNHYKEHGYGLLIIKWRP